MTHIDEAPRSAKAAKAAKAVAPVQGREKKLPTRDRVTVITMVAIPLVLVVLLVWVPALLSVVLSFGKWNGFGDLDTIEWVGVQNYKDIFTIYPAFWPAVQHNLIWLAFLFIFPTILGMLLAVRARPRDEGQPVLPDRVLHAGRAVPGADRIHLAALLLPRPGPHQRRVRLQVDWYGDPDINLWAVLVATAWRHTGYIMLIYLAGLKGVDASLREAAAVDGASEVKTFFHVIFPVMRPINMVVVVIVVIESLRAFDLVWVINKGRNGLEVIGALVAQNVIGEATRYGFGSALAVIMMLISSIFITIYLRTVFREERNR